MSRLLRARLRDALVDRYPWLQNDGLGPRTVDAGMCERCELRPRLLATCGPGVAGALCPACAHAVGDEGWCDGHLADGRAARAWASELPDEWADVVLLYWIATGEIRYDGAWAMSVETRQLPDAVRLPAEQLTRG